jgi:Mg-chelatase subunit ChlD
LSIISKHKNQTNMENATLNPEALKGYDIIVAIDRSGSMGAKLPNGNTRWDGAKEATEALVRKASQFDSNGITVCIFGGKTVKNYENIADADAKVTQIFTENEPASGTPTAEMLSDHLDRYFTAKAAGSNPKPILIAVVTDGQPDNKSAVAKVIKEATHKMEKDEEVGIVFLQIGDDGDATTFLTKLDDDLTAEGAKFDIVDTKKLDEVEDLTEALLGAIND